jgi:hypothetical protein
MHARKQLFQFPAGLFGAIAVNVVKRNIDQGPQRKELPVPGRVRWLAAAGQ